MDVNKKQLADVLGVTERTLTDWQKAPDFPIKEAGGRGRQNIYDTAEVIGWMIRRETGKAGETSKERLERTRAELNEISIAERTGELVPAAEVERTLDDLFAAVRSGQMSGNHKLKKDIDRLHGIDLDIEVLNAHSREILTHLSGLSSEPDGSHETITGETEAA
ncbi:MAG: terminase small subunit [Marinobacterium sp.]|nr:terminase small subunit [Marinobacterium sp.]